MKKTRDASRAGAGSALTPGSEGDTWTGDVTLNPHSFGEAYENFVSRVYMMAIAQGAPTREGLLAGGLTDEAVEIGVSELVARGFLTTTADPDRWEVEPPREAITRNARRLERQVSMARATAVEVEALWRRAVGHRPPTMPRGIELLSGIDTIVNRIAGLHGAATTRLWWAFDDSAASVSLLDQVASDPDRLAVRDEVDVRLVLDAALLDNASALAHAERWRAAGHGVGVVNGLPFATLVCDETVALVDLSGFDAVGEGSFEVRLSAPVRAITRLLEEIWGLATPYAPGLADALQEEDRLPIPERDQKILALLATGASDQVIARQTGISVRTVERRVRWIMDHVGAATRFQAGVQAVRRGWI